MTLRGVDTEGARQVLKNGAHLLLAYVLPRVFTVVSVVLAARWLGTERFGMYGAAAALAVIAGVVGSLGMLPLLVREIAQRPESAGSALSSAHRLKVVTCGAMLAVTWLASGALFGEQPEARAATMVLALGLAVQSFAENVSAYYQAVERMARWTQASALFGIVSAGVGVTLLLLTGSIVAYCAGFAAGWCVALAWLVVGLPAEARGGSAPGVETARILRELGPFAGASIGLTIYCKIDVLLLQAWSNVEQVGLYAAAYKSIEIFQALVIVAASAIYPRLSKAATTPRGGEHASRLSAEILILGAVPVGMSLHLAAGPVVRLLFGGDYAGSVGVQSRLALLMPMLSVTIFGGYILGAAGRMWPVAGLYAAGVVANVLLNAAFIATGGAEGAALARLGSEAILLVGFLGVLRVGVGVAPRGRVFATAAAGVAVGSLLRLMPDATDGILRAAVFMVALAVLYVGARVVRVAELGKLGRALLHPPPSPVRPETA